MELPPVMGGSGVACRSFACCKAYFVCPTTPSTFYSKAGERARCPNDELASLFIPQFIADGRTFFRMLDPADASSPHIINYVFFAVKIWSHLQRQAAKKNG